MLNYIKVIKKHVFLKMDVVVGGKAESESKILSYSFFVLQESSIPDLKPDKCLLNVEIYKKRISC